MSTELYHQDGLYVTRFACGRCKIDGPCFQLTDAIGYVIVHRRQAHDVVRVMLDELGGAASNPSDGGRAPEGGAP